MTTYIAGQAPVAVHPYEQRVQADIGINPWDGDDASLEDGAERHLVPVMPIVRDFIVQQKQLAAANADQLHASLKNTWTELEAASKPIRERRAAERERETWEPTPDKVRVARE